MGLNNVQEIYQAVCRVEYKKYIMCKKYIRRVRLNNVQEIYQACARGGV